MSCLSNNILNHLYPSEESDFPNGWEDEFGSFTWFYLAGYNELVSSHKLDIASPAFEAIRQNAIDLVPEGWISKFPKCDWEKYPTLAKKQTDKAKKSKTLTLDRASMIFAALDAYVKELKLDIDVTDYLTIRPAIYRMTSFDQNLFDTHFSDWNNGNAVELKKITGQKNKTFYEEIIQGYAATYSTLSEIGRFIIDELDVKGFNPNITYIDCRSWHDRSDTSKITDKREKRPANTEAILR